MRKTVFSAYFGKQKKLKKTLCYINLANWLDSRFSTIYFHFHGVISFKKLRISWQIYPLDFVSGAKLSLDSHFPNSKTPGKQENYSVKTFCSHQIWQIYITKYYFLIFPVFSMLHNHFVDCPFFSQHFIIMKCMKSFLKVCGKQVMWPVFRP